MYSSFLHLRNPEPIGRQTDDLPISNFGSSPIDGMNLGSVPVSAELHWPAGLFLCHLFREVI